jgi:hypothetical protein
MQSGTALGLEEDDCQITDTGKQEGGISRDQMVSRPGYQEPRTWPLTLGMVVAAAPLQRLHINEQDRETRTFKHEAEGVCNLHGGST